MSLASRADWESDLRSIDEDYFSTTQLVDRASVSTTGALVVAHRKFATLLKPALQSAIFHAPAGLDRFKAMFSMLAAFVFAAI
jgi:hypothetical protein